ncbi:hypothetical protein N7533_001574 [Penicillium manginii]|uniref:uncharacterized protein n=1 Tax=Penicillium manginii TaxID=203109 RepID=UPI002546D301|nr:uncharacterized protein N7533_001574 [Penicillium manginii]KAJ5762893.1 hypothetical protein N7533_001574 [Penicillium manginii]
MESDPSTPDLPVISPFEKGSFYELVSDGKLRAYEIKSFGPNTATIYYIESNETLSKSKFDLLIHKGDSKGGEVLGVAKRHMRGFTIGLGDPAGEIEGKQIIWEKLERPEKYSHKVYHFDFGKGEQRSTYTFRKATGRTGRLKSMELRVGGVDEEDGKLVAKWVGSSRWNMKNGSLFVADTVKREQDSKQNALREGDANDLEMIVYLTTFAIIESQVRRSKG